MFKLLVLSAILAVAAAAPSHPLAYSSVVAVPEIHTAYALPAAVSHQSRVDYHTKPIVASYVAAAPVVHAAPLVHAAAPLLHSAPGISLTTGPVLHAAPLAHAGSVAVHGSPLLHSW